MTMRKWQVCISPEYDDGDVEADVLWYDQSTGWLTFSTREKKPVAVFAPGKWVSFMEVT